MKRAVSFAFGVVDILLAAFAALYGAFVVFVMLRPWGGSLRALFFARHPEALLAFIPLGLVRAGSAASFGLARSSHFRFGSRRDTSASLALHHQPPATSRHISFSPASRRRFSCASFFNLLLQPRERSNHAMELTASRRTALFSMTSTISPAAARALARSSSSCSR